MDMLNQMELENELEKFDNAIDLGKFIARQQYKLGCTCKEMKEHLAELNGSIKEHENQLFEIEMKQENLMSRIWNSMPGWMQMSVIVWLGLTIIGISAGVKFLV